MAGSGEDEWKDADRVFQKLKTASGTEEVAQIYNQWAVKGYDELFSGGKPSVDKVVAALEELFPLATRGKVALLDIGAGTGLAGQKLKDVGFTAIDGADPAKEMLRVAETKGAYRHLYCCGLGDEPMDIPADSYDAACMAGLLGDVPLEPECFEEVIRLVKPGGFIVNTMYTAYMDDKPSFMEGWPPFLSRMEREGKWQVVTMERYHDQRFNCPGELQVFRVL